MGITAVERNAMRMVARMDREENGQTAPGRFVLVRRPSSSVVGFRRRRRRTRDEDEQNRRGQERFRGLLGDCSSVRVRILPTLTDRSGRSADFQSAVSRVSNPPVAEAARTPGQRLAVWRLGFIIRYLTLVLAMAGSLAAATATNEAGLSVLLVVGAAGEAEFDANFSRQAQLWEQTGQAAGARVVRIGLDETTATTDRERLQQALAVEPTEGSTALWLVLIGHGTFDNQEARFNLDGPDVTAKELADWLKPMRRPLVVVNAASASAPFLNPLSGSNRVVVTATRSGNEQNYARFGEHLAEAISSAASDLDKDGQTSLLEAFLSAAHHVAEFYHTEGRLATEHALLDDTGDGLGTPADWFRGVLPVKQSKDGASVDGARAHQMHLILSERERALPPEVRAQRDALELELARLRNTKAGRPEDEYYRELEALLLELARLYQEAPQGMTND